MTRSSPGVMRIAAILNFMADHPGQAFALTDLVRALKLSRATCHALLAGLVEVGYLYRASDKTYMLGPRLAAIGRAAAEHRSPTEVAQPELRRLADAFDVVSALFVLEGDTIHVRERAASISHVGHSIPLGAQVQLRLPSAAVFLAWTPREAQAWLDRLDPPPLAEEREGFAATLAFGREHGFIAFVQDADAGPLIDARGALPGAEPADRRVAMLTSIAPERSYALRSITAPVYESGVLAFVVGLLGFNRTITGRELLAAADQLRQAAARIGGFLG